MATKKELEELEAASSQSAAFASSALDAQIKSIMNHVDRIDQLKPKTTDEATYQKVVAAVKDATRRNESAAELRANVQKLGSGAMAVLNEMARLARKVA